ncbi:MAG: hypothetical protein MZV63_15295 [Marinilabiliales bacterium]|nr:hypothetical protein [Marinilabiliales bacterium]
MIEAFLEIVDREIVTISKVASEATESIKAWYSAKATAEACYALLLDTKEVSADPNLPIIVVGNKPVEVSATIRDIFQRYGHRKRLPAKWVK